MKEHACAYHSALPVGCAFIRSSCPRTCANSTINDWTVMAMGCAGGNYSTNYSLNGTLYFHQPCVSSTRQSYLNIKSCKAIERNHNFSVQCSQFCGCFREYLPHVYASVSAISALCCLGVFLTYVIFPRLRRAGYSSKIFLYR